MLRGKTQRNMLDDEYMPKQQLLLYYSSFTCIYFPGILMLLKYNDSLLNVGTYMFIPILLILIFAEATKLSFSLLQTIQPPLGKIENKNLARVRNPWSKLLKDTFKFATGTLMTTLVFYVTVVMFGCPLLTHHEETIMLTITLTCLTFVPASLHLGLDDSIALFTGAPLSTHNVLVEAVQQNVKATLLGTWAGATVIPLDWNRPWQAWPIPCITGALVGYMVSHFFTLAKTLSFLKWKKVR